jgi:glycosyltransferase involved in cell wall biosynthesis
MGPEVGQRFGEHMTEKISNAINFGYLRNEKWDLYDACDVFAMPSRVDSFGLVYAEAWMRGKPVIGARCGSVPWVIHEDVDGLLVPFGDVEELARSIIRLIDRPSYRKALGEAGREHVFRTYTVSCVAQRLSELYTSLVKQK